LPGWHSPEQAWAQTQAQLSWYKAMEAAGEMVMIKDKTGLEHHLSLWLNGEPNDNKPIGYILSLEGADSLVTLKHLETAYAYGLRAVGPAHYGPGRYANGTDATGGLQAAGKELLKEMERLNIILDATHLCDDAFWDAMRIFNGPVWASHNNCRALVNHNRQFSDEMIKVLIERGAVIGGALDAWMMVPGWVRQQSTPEGMHCNLEKMLDHLDHICQLAGNALHVGIGTDLDGAFGKEQSPYDLETIADLQKIPTLLAKRGYVPEDIEAIMHGNWLRFLRKAWDTL
jgi:membrane dipeptidase